MTRSDKRARAQQFRQRLARAVDTSGINQSALARAIGVDRSTVSQLLSGRDARLPNAQVIAECAGALEVSADWLLGLTERPERPGAVLDAQMVLTEAERSSADEQIDAWHREAAGYKIRHVPATLPDMLKTDAMLTWEYGPQLARTTQQVIGAADDRFDWFVSQDSNYELAVPRHELESFARAEGYYRGLPLETRLAQLERFQRICDGYYPSLRLYLFDARQVFSAPISVYGPLLAVVYLGQHYIAFRETSRVRTFTAHFDGLVRAAVVDARDISRMLQALSDEIAGRSKALPV